MNVNVGDRSSLEPVDRLHLKTKRELTISFPFGTRDRNQVVDLVLLQAPHFLALSGGHCIVLLVVGLMTHSCLSSFVKILSLDLPVACVNVVGVKSGSPPSCTKSRRF